MWIRSLVARHDPTNTNSTLIFGVLSDWVETSNNHYITMIHWLKNIELN